MFAGQELVDGVLVGTNTTLAEYTSVPPVRKYIAMIHITAAPINDLAGLREALQNAIRLEFFTIPPYLTALYSLSGTTLSAQYGRTVIRDIVQDEMLHMNLVCNILNAIGGTPEISAPTTVPVYPNKLPMAIAGGIEVHLERYSHKLVKDVFMAIEEPEVPLDLPIKKNLFAAVAPGPRTIGQFYAAIRAEIIRQGKDIFTGKEERQVTGFFRGSADIKVVDVDTAVLAIDTIVEQGEGTTAGPSDLQNDIAHFYRFQELEKGMKLVPDAGSRFKFSFDPNQPITIDDNADVTRMIDDPQNVVLDPADADVAAMSDACDASYSDIVKALQLGYNGDPDQMIAIDLSMVDLAGLIRELMAKDLHGAHAGFRAGPRFRFIP